MRATDNTDPEPPRGSPFRRIVALDYYDGLKEGIAECPQGHLAVLRMIAWDNLQDLRVFAVWELPKERFDALVAKMHPSARPTWPFYLAPPNAISAVREAIDEILRQTVGDPDYVLASADPTKTFLAVARYRAGMSLEGHDWFTELGLTRAGGDAQQGDDHR